MIINISDVYVRHQRYSICDDMNDFLSDFKNAEFVEGLGMELQKKPNHLKNPGVYVEPMWVWRKKD